MTPFSVHLKGFEPPTISFGSCYSIQLSYKCKGESYYTMRMREMQEQMTHSSIHFSDKPDGSACRQKVVKGKQKPVAEARDIERRGIFACSGPDNYRGNL